MDSTVIVGELLIISGCLHDVIEKTSDENAAKSLNEVNIKLQNFLNKNFPATMRIILSDSAT